jgi:hypothetical protein
MARGRSDRGVPTPQTLETSALLRLWMARGEEYKVFLLLKHPSDSFSRQEEGHGEVFSLYLTCR